MKLQVKHCTSSCCYGNCLPIGISHWKDWHCSPGELYEHAELCPKVKNLHEKDYLRKNMLFFKPYSLSMTTFLQLPIGLLTIWPGFQTKISLIFLQNELTYLS